MRRIVIVMVLALLGTQLYAQDGCSKYGPDSAQTLVKYSLYREFYKQKNYDDARGNWRYVFLNAPGFKQRTFGDGANMFNKLVKKEKDPVQKDLLVDTLLMIFDKRIECFRQGYGRKGMALYQFRSKDKMAIHKLFQDELNKRGNKADYFILGPAMENAIKLQKEEKIEKSEVLNMLDKINGIIDFNVAKGGKKGPKYAESSEIVNNSIPAGFLSCDEAKSIFGPKYQEKPDDENLWKSIFNSFRSAKCTDDDLFLEVARKYNEKEPTALKARAIALGLVKKGQFSEATGFFKQAIELEEDATKKAELSLDLGKIYAYKLKDFPTGRSYARKAASMKSGWGDPYLFIADMYASSGSMCGSGTGYKSQRVTWVAIDMYNKAKTVDPSVAGKANEGITKYKAFMPTAEDGFMNGGLKEGDTVTLDDCWIGESTTVRFAK